MRKNGWMVSVMVFLVAVVSQNAMAEWTELTPSVVGGDLTARRAFAMAYVGGDKVVLFGGNDGVLLNDTWLYDAGDNRWTKQNPTVVGGSLSARQLMGMAYIGDDQALMFGGDRSISETWLYDLSENKWTRLYPNINGLEWSGRGHTDFAYLGQGKILMFGGYNGRDLNDTWIFDMSENEWRRMMPAEIEGSLTIRCGMQLSYIADGKAILFAGQKGGAYYDDTWIYDLASNTWTKMSPIVHGGVLSGRRAHGLNYIGGDKVVMFGGEIAGGYRGQNDIWTYDLSDNTWTMFNSSAGSNPPPRCYFGQAAIGSGKIVIFGGYDINKFLNDTWTFTVDDFGASTVTATPVTGGVEVSWSIPSELTDISFYVYKNGAPISHLIETGTPQNGSTVFSFFDDTVVSGTLNRYKVMERFSTFNSEVFYPEITVPYCQ